MRRILIEKENIDPKTCSFGFPWKHDSICYNFNMPDECVTAESIGKIEDPADIETLVIGCDLDDYSFIGDMVNLEQLYIYSGANIDSLRFIKDLNSLCHLYITDSHITSLEPLRDLIQQRKSLYDAETEMFKRLLMLIEGICIDSDNDLDGKILKDLDFYVAEIIINRKRIH